MQIISIKDDGTVVIEMSASEAREIRNDLGGIPFKRVTGSGGQLHRLLEWATPSRRT